MKLKQKKDHSFFLNYLRNPGLLLLSGMLLFIAIIGAWLVWFNTPFRMGMFPDSVIYIMGARNILAGNGFTYFSGTDGLKLITMWPPLYSYVLAFIGLTGMDAIRVTRLLNIVLMGLDLLLFSGLVYYETRNKLLSIHASLLFLFSAPLFLRYTWALTEPLFFTLFFGNIILYYLFVRTQKSGWAMALGFGTAFLFLARYVSSYLCAVWLPAILLLARPKTRLKNAILFPVGFLPPVILYLFSNYLSVGTLNNRNPSLTGIPGAVEKIGPAMGILEGWFSSTGTGLATHILSLVLLYLLMLALLAGGVVIGMQLYTEAGTIRRQPDRQAILSPLSLALPFYVITILINTFYIDNQFMVDDRILSPMWFFGLYLLVLIADLVIRKGRLHRYATYACLLVLLVFSIVKYQKISADLRSDGQGFFSEKWRNSLSMEYIRQTRHELIYSDEPMAIYILTGKVAYQVPFIMYGIGETNLVIKQQYDFMRERLIESDGILVLFFDECSDLTVEWNQILTRDLHLIEKVAGTCIFAP